MNTNVLYPIELSELCTIEWLLKYKIWKISGNRLSFPLCIKIYIHKHAATMMAWCPSIRLFKCPHIHSSMDCNQVPIWMGNPVHNTRRKKREKKIVEERTRIHLQNKMWTFQKVQIWVNNEIDHQYSNPLFYSQFVLFLHSRKSKPWMYAICMCVCVWSALLMNFNSEKDAAKRKQIAAHLFIDCVKTERWLWRRCRRKKYKYKRRRNTPLGI